MREMGRFAAAGLVAAVLSLSACAGKASKTAEPKEPEPVSIESTSTDEMFSERANDARLRVFVMDDRTRTVDTLDEITVPGEKPLEEGHFYNVVADVTYLNGGVAGYVNYPEVERVKSCNDVSPLDMGLPALEPNTYGLLLIGDYADGDVLLRAYGKAAVWKDGSWVYRYDKEIDLPDGKKAAVRKGVTADSVSAGANSGVLSCVDYFVLP